MPSSLYFNKITSESAFRARFQAESQRPFRELDYVAASSWGRSHLFACRVVRREPQRNILPSLSKYTEPTAIQSAPDEIRKFLQGPDSSFKDQSEHSLVRGSNYGISLGQIWAALATFKGQQDRQTQNSYPRQELGENRQDDESIPRYSKRVRRNTINLDFIDSSGIQAGSSSPPLEGYSSPRSSSLSYVDSDAHFLDTNSEDDTLRLASCVIRHILYFAEPQEASCNAKVVEFRDAKTRLEAITPAQQRQMVAIDDGGLCLRQAESSKVFSLVNNHVAIVEAKTKFQYLEDGVPMISDDCFAQMVCEALVASIPKVATHEHQSVLLIHATRNYMCFLQFDISADYLYDFENTAPEHFLYVSATPWFDLSKKGGRESVLANICGIMRLAISDLDE